MDAIPTPLCNWFDVLLRKIKNNKMGGRNAFLAEIQASKDKKNKRRRGVAVYDESKRVRKSDETWFYNKFVPPVRKPIVDQYIGKTTKIIPMGTEKDIVEYVDSTRKCVKDGNFLYANWDKISGCKELPSGTPAQKGAFLQYLYKTYEYLMQTRMYWTDPTMFRDIVRDEKNKQDNELKPTGNLIKYEMEEGKKMFVKQIERARKMDNIDDGGDSNESMGQIDDTLTSWKNMCSDESRRRKVDLSTLSDSAVRPAIGSNKVFLEQPDPDDANQTLFDSLTRKDYGFILDPMKMNVNILTNHLIDNAVLRKPDESTSEFDDVCTRDMVEFQKATRAYTSLVGTVDTLLNHTSDFHVKTYLKAVQEGSIKSGNDRLMKNNLTYFLEFTDRMRAIVTAEYDSLMVLLGKGDNPQLMGDFDRVAKVIIQKRAIDKLFAADKKTVKHKVLIDTFATILAAYNEFKHQYDIQQQLEQKNPQLAKYTDHYNKDIIVPFQSILTFGTYDAVLAGGSKDDKRMAKNLVKVYMNPINAARARNALMYLLIDVKPNARKEATTGEAIVRLMMYDTVIVNILRDNLTFSNNVVIIEQAYDTHVKSELSTPTKANELKLEINAKHDQLYSIKAKLKSDIAASDAKNISDFFTSWIDTYERGESVAGIPDPSMIGFVGYTRADDLTRRENLNRARALVPMYLGGLPMCGNDVDACRTQILMLIDKLSIAETNVNECNKTMLESVSIVTDEEKAEHVEHAVGNEITNALTGLLTSGNMDPSNGAAIRVAMQQISKLETELDAIRARVVSQDCTSSHMGGTYPFKSLSEERY